MSELGVTKVVLHGFCNNQAKQIAPKFTILVGYTGQ